MTEVGGTVLLVLVGVEFHARPPFEVVSVYPTAYRVGALEGGPQTWSTASSGRLRRALRHDRSVHVGAEYWASR